MLMKLQIFTIKKGRLKPYLSNSNRFGLCYKENENYYQQVFSKGCKYIKKGD